MPSNNLPVSQFCVFCYRNYSSIIPDDKKESFNKFTKLIGRYLGDQEFEKSFDLQSLTSSSSCKIGCCSGCLFQIERFSKVYDQYKCFELKLQFEIFKLVNIIKLANKVPSRTSQLKKAIEESQVTNDLTISGTKFKRVQSLRKEFAKKCRSKLAKSQPRVILTAKASLLNSSKPKLPEQNQDDTTTQATSTINTETITEPEKDPRKIDVSQACNGNSFEALGQTQTITSDPIITITEDLEPISINKKHIINIAEISSRADNDNNKRQDWNDDFVSRENIAEDDASAPFHINTNVRIENSTSASLEEDAHEDTHSLPDCDNDPLDEDYNGENDLMDYTECAVSDNDPLLNYEKSFSKPHEDSIAIQEKMLPSPCSITIEPTISCYSYFKTESNTDNHSTLESESPEHSSFLSETIISNGEVNEISTHSIYPNISPNELILEQNRQTVCSTTLQDQQDTSINEIQHETATIVKENEESNRNNTDQTEAQPRYNLRKKLAPKFSLESDDELSDNDNDQDFSDKNTSSSSSSSDSFSDSETREVSQLTSGVKRKRCRRKVNVGNGTGSVSKEEETINCSHGCAKVFQNEELYQNHLKLHSSGQFPCNFCKVVLTNVIELSAHEYKDHCPNDFNTDMQKQCPRCLLKFDFPFEYEEHFAFAHFGIGNNPSAKAHDDSISPSNKNLFPCRRDGCHKTFRNKNLYNAHEKLHSHGQFLCKFCKFVAPNLISLANHEHTHHCSSSSDKEKVRQCPRCLLKFKFSFDYEDHFSYAHFGIGENPETKEKRRSRRQPRKGMDDKRKRKIFDNHTFSSNEKNVFRCYLDGCNKVFRNEKIYRNHSNLHLNGKYPCNFCEIVATTVINLAYHEYKKHVENKSDVNKEKQCPRCLLKFKYSFDYEDHFAYAHFGIGENPETKQKRRLKGQPRNDIIYPPNEYDSVPIISCKVCNRKMPKTYRASHMKKWHDAKNETKLKLCKFENCQAYFLTDKELKYHSVSHREEITTFYCYICKLTFSGRLLLRRHIRQKHNSSLPQEVGTEQQPNQLPCNFCDFMTNVPKTLAIHEEELHVQETANDSDKNSKKRRCPRCPYKYEIQGCYVIHHLTIHLKLLSVNSPNACKLCSTKNSFVLNSKNHFKTCHNINLLDDPTKVFKCDAKDCPAYFLTSYQMYCHKTKTHPMLDCLKCEKTFKTRSKLLSHLRVCQKKFSVDNHPNLDVTCDNPICTKMFHNEEEMKMHKLHAHPRNAKMPKQKDKICPDCGKAFDSIVKLKLHLKMGHNQPSCVCSECGKVFKYQYILDKHMIFHKGPTAWEYQCTECGKKCFDKQKLEEHLRIHTKEKPFVCQFCGGKYAHRHNWRNHLKTKHGDEKGIDEIVGKGKKGNYLSRKGSKKGECITGNNVIAQ